MCQDELKNIVQWSRANKEIITAWFKRIIYTKKQQCLKKHKKTKNPTFRGFFGF